MKTAQNSQEKSKKQSASAKTPSKRKAAAVKPEKPTSIAARVHGPVIKKKIHGVNLHILGTAHVSQQSVEDVRAIIGKNKGDVIAVELCPSRFQAINDADTWKKLDIVKVIKERKLYLLMSTVILSIFQKKIGEQTHTKPGAEMLEAYHIAREKKLPLELIDRDIQITLKRAWQSVGFFSRLTIISELIVSVFYREKFDPQEIEAMKNRDVLEDMLMNLPPRYAHIRNIIIDERDRYMAQKLRHAAKKHAKAQNLIAVVGAGHLPGIEKYIDEDRDIKELETVKKKSRLSGALQLGLPVIIILGILAYFTDLSSVEAILRNLGIWIGTKAVLPALAVVLLRGHILAAAAAAASGPISNFNPVFKPGWMAALIEAKFHKPKVEDFENITHDSESISGLLRNKVSRIFLLFILPQLASSVATGLALWWIARS